MRIKRFGWVRDIPDQRDFRYKPPPKLTRALPPRVDLRGGFLAVYNQGELGSCTANALAGALQFQEEKEGEAQPVMPSRLFIYYNERALEGTVASDSGAQIRDGIKSVANLGVCSEQEWPYAIGSCKVTGYDAQGEPIYDTGTTFKQKPSAACYKDALKYEVLQYQRLQNVLPQLDRK